MLSPKQITQVKEHLEKAQNPLFFYDNDCDGLCSFLILRRYLDRGKGVAVRSYPDLSAQYARKARELNADYIFVLDKPFISREFIDEISNIGLPIVWIDHHAIQSAEFTNLPPSFFMYNSVMDNNSSEPVTFIAYSLTKRKEDLWLAIIGCIADHYLPEFAKEFAENYPEFWGKVKKPFDAYYNTEIGRIAQSFNFGLKDSTTNVVRLQNFLLSCKGPDEVFMEQTINYGFRKRYHEIRKKYDSLLEKAKKSISEKIISFSYSGDLSISSDISNELSYLYPDKYIIVAYKKGALSNISIRGKNVKQILSKILPRLENASGGGHEDAVGARIKTEDLTRFIEIFNEEI